MIYWMFKKYKEYKFKRALRGNYSHVHIERGIECTAAQNVKLSDYVYIGPNCRLYGYGQIRIGFNTIIGNDVTILTTNHNYLGSMLPYDKMGIHKDVIVGDNVWIASNVFILPGVNIGEGAVVAGGSVVVRSIPPLAIVGGNPARIIKYRNEEEYAELVNERKFYLVSKYNEKKVK